MADLSDSKRKELETRKRLGRRLPKSQTAPFAPTAPVSRGGRRAKHQYVSPPTRDSV
jgi:hypothetical protein